MPNKYTKDKSKASTIRVPAIEALAFISALLALLKALAVVFEAPRFGALATFFLLAHLGQFIPELSVLAVEALAVHPAYIASAEALAVPGLAPGLEALALDLPTVPVFLGGDG